MLRQHKQASARASCDASCVAGQQGWWAQPSSIRRASSSAVLSIRPCPNMARVAWLVFMALGFKAEVRNLGAHCYSAWL
jgi:hypothetical protein